jgi:membrane-bound metal-dependent hydrolase YbcI (DUF457 family)
MIAGHFGFAALVKSRERQAPLWALMIACQWLDVVFIPLLVAHLESLQPVAGSKGGYGEVIIHADYTHSLLGALVLSALFAVLCGLRWGRRQGLVLGLVAFSHWVLDLVVHRGDMPLLPGNAGDLPRLGFGLWQLPWLSQMVELVLVAAGALLYWRAAAETSVGAGRARRTADLAGALLLLSGVLILTLNVLGQ